MAVELAEKTIVITGASSGIGRATAIACAAAGMDIVINGRRAAELGKLADDIRAMGRRCAVHAGDVTALDAHKRLLDVAEQELGGFYSVFANAGYGYFRRNHETDVAALRRIFEVNFFAANELLCEAARRLIAAKRPGHLLMCSSVASRFALPRFGAYCATKAAQSHMCQAMRNELRPFRIAVTSVHPSTTSTGFFENAGRVTDELGAKMPADLGRPDFLSQRPEDVSRAIVRCLRGPRAEVWPLGWLRYVSGLIAVSPWMINRIGRQLERLKYE